MPRPEPSKKPRQQDLQSDFDSPRFYDSKGMNSEQDPTYLPRSLSSLSDATLADIDHQQVYGEDSDQADSGDAVERSRPQDSLFHQRQLVQHHVQQQLKEQSKTNLWTWFTQNHILFSHYTESMRRRFWSSAQAGEDQDQTELEKEAAKRLWQQSRDEARTWFDLSQLDWIAVRSLVAISILVRIWRIGSPGEVVMDEAYLGQSVNGYLANEYRFDIHPPLGKLFLAGIRSFFSTEASQKELFGFSEIGIKYPGTVPVVSMRTAFAFMSSMCPPLAYLTLKTTGHGPITALLAATFLLFDNALVASNRLMVLDSPLLCFTALSIMAWNMFTKQLSRPFTQMWWTWLLATGLSISACLSLKLSGVFCCLTIYVLATRAIVSLTQSRSTSSSSLARQASAMFGSLVLLPAAIYLLLFKMHFDSQTHQPMHRDKPQGEYDINLLSYSYKNSLASPYSYEKENVIWSDVVYGSVVQLQNDVRPNTHLHSFDLPYQAGSKQQQVGAYEYVDMNNDWIVILANATAPEPVITIDDETGEKSPLNSPIQGEIPARLTYLKHGDLLRLRHLATRKCLHSQNVRPASVYGEKAHEDERSFEVSAKGAADSESKRDDEPSDWWVIEMLDTDTFKPLSLEQNEKTVNGRPSVKALSTPFRLRHVQEDCYLTVSPNELPESEQGGGRKGIFCQKDAKIEQSNVWHFSMNDHDFIPMDADYATYPDISYWTKFSELHRLMLTKPRAFESSLTKERRTVSPLKWPLNIGSTALTVWKDLERHQQVTIVGNPIVWWLSALGPIAFMASTVGLMVRARLGITENRIIRDFKKYLLSDASVYFTAWAAHYVPYLALSMTQVSNRLYGPHHYFPALFFSVLLTCSLSSGAMVLVPRKTRVGILCGVTFLTLAVFYQFSSLTYGSEMSNSQCRSFQRSLLFWTKDPRVSQMDCSAHRDPTKNVEPERTVRLAAIKPRKRPAPLESRYPTKDTLLPMQHRFQSPSQRPPQLWDEEPEAIEMDEYQRQQMETIESKMKKQTLIQEHVWGLYAIRMHHLKRLRKKELIQMDFFLRREDPEVSIKEDLEDMIAALKKKEEEKAKELDGTPAEEEEGQEEEDQEEEEEDQEAEEVDEADEEVQAPTEPVAEEVKID